ncbi:phage tail assembly chaperone [Stakelama saccharophila]|uniref:Phage tail assembly chaperone n=1 Tax=Stakelama saccharophila TaxID=3075605 RepID=A0ABZ0B7Z0_9SPHN|nr:phage tail assembly chaperone [Stakelama sp. W311]WNO53541.1 phage tail assembly chaperone [Stakelama sp. W311]
MAGIAGVLFGWSPDAFWAATPAELGALVRAIRGDGGDTIERATVDRLMEMFPDG